jgi:hypothetical protein
MSFYTVRWHYKLETGNYDLSINNNPSSRALLGKFLQSPGDDAGEPGERTARSTSSSARMSCCRCSRSTRARRRSFVSQSTLLGLGALPLFGFARRHVSPWLAVAVALHVILVIPPDAQRDVHTTATTSRPATLLRAGATVWALEEQRWCVVRPGLSWPPA